MMILAGLVIVSLVQCTFGQLQAHSCSISCPGVIPISGGSVNDNVRMQVGAPGKRGAVGPPGLAGRVGEKGAKGEKGEAYNCQPLVDEVQQLQATIANLKKFVLSDRGWSKASNGRWYKRVTTQMTYQQGREVCRNQGGILASAGMRNATIIREVVGIIGMGLGRQQWTWIGLTDAEREGVWVWDDGSTEPVNNWLPGQPDNAGSNENCAHFYSATGSFNDYVCEEKLQVLCEISKL